MLIREAEFNDYSQIARLHTANWQQAYQDILDNDYLDQRLASDQNAMWQTRLTQPSLNQGILVAESQGVICGFVCLYGNHSFDYGTMIDNLHVADGYRGQGLGKQLLAAAAQWASQHFSSIGIYLEVLKQNQPAKEFYLSIHAQDAGEVIWKAPCGSSIVCHSYTWDSPQSLLEQTLPQVA